MKFKSKNGSVIKINYVIDDVVQEFKSEEAVINAEINILVKSNTPIKKESNLDILNSVANLL